MWSFLLLFLAVIYTVEATSPFSLGSDFADRTRTELIAEFKTSPLQKLASGLKNNATEETLTSIFANLPEDSKTKKVLSASLLSVPSHVSSMKNSHMETMSTLPSDVCMSPHSLSVSNLCVGAVDYDFHVPVTDNNLLLSFLALESEIGLLFKNSGLKDVVTLLPQKCADQTKRTLCSAVFRRCVAPGADIPLPEEIHALNPLITLKTYTSSQKTCNSCNALAESCSYISGLVFGLDVPTYEVMCNSLLTNYISSDSSDCNEITTPGMLAASHQEPYIGEVCKNFIGDTLYIPDGSTLSSEAAPIADLLPPFFMQTVMESLLTEQLVIPTYLTSACQASVRQLFCGTYMMSTQVIFSGDTDEESVFLPRYPARTVCTNYRAVCPDLLSLNAALNVDCEAMKGDLYDYPETEQVFMPGVATQADPMLSLDGIVYPEHCPYGFGVTDRPGDPGTLQLIGACSVKCPLPMYTDDEYDGIYLQCLIMFSVVLAFTLAQIVNVCVLRYARRNVFLICSIVATFVYMFLQIIQLLLVDQGELVCSSPTSWYTWESYGESLGANMCVSLSVVSTWNTLFSWWILVALSCEMWVRVALNVKKVEYHRLFYMWGLLAWFIGHAFFVTFWNDPVVTVPAGFGVFCGMVQLDAEEQYYSMALPGTIYFCFSFFLICHSLYICVSTSLRVQDIEKNPFRKIWRSYGMLFMFLGLSVIIYPISIFLFSTKWSYIDTDLFGDGVIDWLLCLFLNFNSFDPSDTTYIDTCGDRPLDKYRIPFDALLGTFLAPSYMVGVFLFLITLNKEVKIFWYNLGVRILSVPCLLTSSQNRYFQEAKDNQSTDTSEFSDSDSTIVVAKVHGGNNGRNPKTPFRRIVQWFRIRLGLGGKNRTSRVAVTSSLDSSNNGRSLGSSGNSTHVVSAIEMTSPTVDSVAPITSAPPAAERVESPAEPFDNLKLDPAEDDLEVSHLA